MPSLLPEGETPPTDGSLPETALENVGTIPFSFYLHVPYCKSRCGYCDFNTYVQKELEEHDQSDWVRAAVGEIKFARKILKGVAPVETIFVGGGTPTLLPARELGQALSAIQDNFDTSSTLEVTTEANPDSVTLQSLNELREAGFNRISFGVQSFRQHVLAVLDRTHNPEAVEQAISWAKAAGFENISIDLIYGTPGETLDDVQFSLEQFYNLEIPHISAYALIVEEGTQLSRKVKSNQISAPDDDLMADKYELIDAALTDYGFEWYELSNWTLPGYESQHNLHYWHNHNWWGIGPGAHSHINSVRWWNVKLPHAWVSKVLQGVSPAHSREVLSDQQKRVEQILLNIRLSSGLESKDINRDKIESLNGEGLLEIIDDRIRLTRKGRLLADYVVRELTT
ncbi:MAG: radical SAM family heme chaperone HemW [Candidatus Nanopelagicales bacterium]